MTEKPPSGAAFLFDDRPAAREYPSVLINRRLVSHLHVRSRIGYRRWRRRLVFVAGGLAVGAAAVLMAELAYLAQHAFRAAVGELPTRLLELRLAGSVADR